jgi:hypothetical protein
VDIKTIVQQVKDKRFKAGGAVSAELLEQLRAYRQQQKRMFFVIEAITILGMAICTYVLLSTPVNGDTVKTLAGVLGLGAGTGGGIEMMRRAWREWSRADLLLLLLSGASESQVTTIMDKLATAL